MWSVEHFLAAWSRVHFVGLFFLLLQVAAVILGAIPRIRRALQATPCVMALVLTTPLLWVLFEISVNAIFSCQGHFNARHHWLVLADFSVVLGTTVVLQAILGLQYARKSLAIYPTLGLFAALLAVSCDAVFVLAAVAPPELAGPHAGRIENGWSESPSGEATAWVRLEYFGPFHSQDRVRLRFCRQQDDWCVIETDLTKGSDGQKATVVGVSWISDDEILVNRITKRGDDDIVFNTATHTWRPP